MQRSLPSMSLTVSFYNSQNLIMLRPEMVILNLENMSNGFHCCFFLSISRKDTGQVEKPVLILKQVLLQYVITETFLTLRKYCKTWDLESGFLGLNLNYDSQLSHPLIGDHYIYVI